MKRQLRSFRPQLECLEVRDCPTGLVTATLGTDGTLLIKGDAGNNGIDVDGSLAGFISVTGTGFTSVNGVASASFNSASVARITIQLADGSDNATVHDLSLPDKLTITDNKGFDSYSLNALTLATGSISVTTGESFDFVNLNTVIAGSVKIDTGASGDSVNVGGSTVGSMNILTGDGTDFISLNNDTFGSLTVDAGKNDDTITLSTVTVTGAISVKAGDGNDGVSAANTTAGSGTVDGGNNSDVFQNGGGNAGWSTTNFEGFI